MTADRTNEHHARRPSSWPGQGLNLIPLEYIFARSESETAGVVLASEFSACSSLLNGAVRINPFDVAKTAAAMEQALTMSEGERSVTVVVYYSQRVCPFAFGVSKTPLWYQLSAIAVFFFRVHSFTNNSYGTIFCHFCHFLYVSQSLDQSLDQSVGAEFFFVLSFCLSPFCLGARLFL